MVKDYTKALHSSMISIVKEFTCICTHIRTYVSHCVCMHAIMVDIFMGYKVCYFYTQVANSIVITSCHVLVNSLILIYEFMEQI